MVVYRSFVVVVQYERSTNQRPTGATLLHGLDDARADAALVLGPVDGLVGLWRHVERGAACASQPYHISQLLLLLNSLHKC